MTPKPSIGGKKDTPKPAVSRKGLKMMIVGVLVLISGFLLLSGGGSKDPAVFNYAMFDFRRLVAAPVVIPCGIVIEVVAIMGNFSRREDGK